LCFMMVAILLYFDKVKDVYRAAAFIFLFQNFYGLGWLPVPWCYPSEVIICLYWLCIHCKLTYLSDQYNISPFQECQNSLRVQLVVSLCGCEGNTHQNSSHMISHDIELRMLPSPGWMPSCFHWKAHSPCQSQWYLKHLAQRLKLWSAGQFFRFLDFYEVN